MPVSLWLLLWPVVAGKVVNTEVHSEGPEIVSQFCFPTVCARQGQGTIALEAKSALQGQKVAILDILSSAEIHAMLRDNGCQVGFRQRVKDESFLLLNLAKPDRLYSTQVQVPGPKPDLCVSVVVLQCRDTPSSDTAVQVNIRIEYLNEGLNEWSVGLSLEDQGMPMLFSFFTLATAVIALVYWRYSSDLEAIAVHEDLSLVTKVMYAALVLEMASWWGFYMTYVSGGMPWLTFKWTGSLADWAFQLSALCLLAMHSTGHFLQIRSVLTEVKVVLVLDALFSLYFALLKCAESETVAEFHWLCHSSSQKWLRLIVLVVLFLWSVQGIESYKSYPAYTLLAYGGLAWVCGLPGIVVVSKWMLRFRWKFWQACFGALFDVSFAAFLLYFLSPSRAPALFAQERVTQSLKAVP